MSTVYKEFIVERSADDVWSALRDFPAVHTRLAPGFLTHCVMDAEGGRTLTFANGLVAREFPVAIDDAHRRLAYTVIGGKAQHHHASAQVFAEGEGRARFVWTTDVLPDAMATYIEPMMDAGLQAMKKQLEESA